VYEAMPQRVSQLVHIATFMGASTDYAGFTDWRDAGHQRL
jgi:hypothetical protein